MELKLAYQDLGTTCPSITRGETMEELTANAAKHAKEVHDYTDAQLNDPKMVEKSN